VVRRGHARRFIAKGHLARLKETHLDGPADLVVEIGWVGSGKSPCRRRWRC